MRKELLDKEVLCILDTRQIQRYMFRSNSYFDSLGGSDLMTHILGDAILFALRNVDPPLAADEYDISMDPDVSEIPWFASEKTQFQLISNVAGNAICLVRSGALCQQLIRKISRYYLDHAYSLNLAAAVTEKTDNLQKDTSALYEQLEKVKAAGEISDPLGALPIVRREHNTGDPAVGLDEETGEFYSTVSEMKRAEARKRPLLIQMKDMKPFRTSGGKDYLAVIHADGAGSWRKRAPTRTAFVFGAGSAGILPKPCKKRYKSPSLSWRPHFGPSAEMTQILFTRFSSVIRPATISTASAVRTWPSLS